ncbi:alpha-hydroxyketone-type quorum-sensing autoinducer synthase [Chryseobacterium sp.]|uniref:alpha-hydroxyketone-type quorum-sensing autoinducer synthase n=1 Tax=Chryseobacterium sp. TaxID=1871047 RepID=UPI00289DD486|nr:alpha-hydroxyketone-type quorum-sensing autoinducer synthase [Chryseobacterium sp.]
METQFNHSVITENHRKYPDFIAKKMDDFYVNRLQKEWEGRHIIRGRMPEESSINLTSNDYLRLSTETHVLNCQAEILTQISNMPLMSASFIHGEAPQAKLENRFAKFFEAESAILCQSGYVANLGLMQTLIEDMDIPVYTDSMAHMSIWNGIRLGGGKAVQFAHNDVDHLMQKINALGSGIIVVDAVYSTDGSIAPLPQLAEIARSKNCMLIVDESHSFGTHGPNGKGLVVGLGIQETVLFRTASLAKTFASRAGLILCPHDFADFFNVTSKPQIFSSALMPFDIAGLGGTLDLVDSQKGDERRSKLVNYSTILKDHLQELGIDVSESNSQILGIKAKSENNLLHLKEMLENERIFGAPFCLPATARKRPILRFSLHSELDPNDIQYIASSCRKALTELNI